MLQDPRPDLGADYLTRRAGRPVRSAASSPSSRPWACRSKSATQPKKEERPSRPWVFSSHLLCLCVFCPMQGGAAHAPVRWRFAVESSIVAAVHRAALGIPCAAALLNHSPSSRALRDQYLIVNSSLDFVFGDCLYLSICLTKGPSWTGSSRH